MTATLTVNGSLGLTLLDASGLDADFSKQLTKTGLILADMTRTLANASDVAAFSGTDFDWLYFESIDQELYIGLGHNATDPVIAFKVPAGCALILPAGSIYTGASTFWGSPTADNWNHVEIRNDSGNEAKYRLIVGT